MSITLMGKQVSTLDQINEILVLARASNNSETIGRCLFAITDLAPGTIDAELAQVELNDRWQRSVDAGKAKSALSPTRIQIAAIATQGPSIDSLLVTLAESRSSLDNEAVGRTLHTIAQLAPTAPEAVAANLEIEERWRASRENATKITREESNSSYDAFATQRHKRGRKSHLAAAVNQSIHDTPLMGCIWYPLIIIGIIAAVILALSK